MDQAQTNSPAQVMQAEQVQQASTPNAGQAKAPGFSDFLSSPLFWVVIAVWIMVFWSMKKQKTKDEERKKELDTLKKGDRVLTIGRMHGTIVSLTDKNITLKPDEKNNLTMKFDRSAILKVFGKDENEDTDGGDSRNA